MCMIGMCFFPVFGIHDVLDGFRDKVMTYFITKLSRF